MHALQIERYHFFPASIRAYDPNGRSHLERRGDEASDTGVLSSCDRLLRDVHRRFFQGGQQGGLPLVDRDVRAVLAEARREVLRGCKLVFSRWAFECACPRRWPVNSRERLTCFACYSLC